MPRSVADTLTGAENKMYSYKAALWKWFELNELNEPYYEFVRRCVALCWFLCIVLLIRRLCRCISPHCSCDKEAAEGDISSAGDRDAIRAGQGGENIRC